MCGWPWLLFGSTNCSLLSLLSNRDVDFLGHNSHDSFLAECISNGDDALIFLLINFEKKIPSPFVFLGGEEGVVVV